MIKGQMKTLLTFLIVLTLAIPAAAAPQCALRDTVLTHLEQKYQETPEANGVTTTGGLIELLVNKDKDTWTLIISTPQGMSCLVAAGNGWREIKTPLGEVL